MEICLPMKSEMMCKIDVSEFLDRLSILYVKSKKITDVAKLKFINEEIAELQKEVDETANTWLNLLIDLHSRAWDSNEARKNKIQLGIIDEEYIQLTIQESQLNDERYQLKQRISMAFNTALHEQKSFPWLS